MLKSFLAVLLLAGVLVSSTHAQVEHIQAREAEWKSYSLPQTAFIRHTSPEKDFVLRVPVDWKQEGTQLVFSGPHSSSFRVIVEKVPDGLPLQDYVAAIIRTVDGLMGADVSAQTRRTHFQDLEAREIVFESPNAEGDLIHTTSWVTVVGPLAASFALQSPVAHTQELEPYFKAIVQSVMFVSTHQFDQLEKHRSAIKGATPSPVNEIQDAVSSLNEPLANRESAIKRLTSIFEATPDLAVDLLMDRRPLVRAAAVEALARNNNASLEEFLWEAIGDREPVVAEPAARRLVSTSDLLKKVLDHSFAGLRFDVLARVWPFMSKEQRIELLQTVFSRTAVKSDAAPPPALRRSRPGVSVTVTELTAVVPSKEKVLTSLSGVPVVQDPNVQIGMLTLLGDLTPSEFRLPLQRLIEANYDPLTIVGLQVANNRTEELPIDSLLKLAASTDRQVRKLALLNLGISASVSDIPRIEALKRNSSKPVADSSTGTSQPDSNSEINLSIRKIRFRDQLDSAKLSGQSTASLIETALTDPILAEFAWRYAAEGTNQTANIFGHENKRKSELVVKPLAENVFPKKVTHFVAIPNPGQAVEKFYDSLRGIQMDSPRAQSSLVLMMGGARQILGQQLGAPPEASSLIEYTGIKSDSPITLAEWIPEGSPFGIAGAKRKAIILRVNDRERFERTVELFQKTAGEFTSLTDYLAIGARAMAALPALLPFTAKELLSTAPPMREPDSMLGYALVAETRLNELPVKVIQHRRLNSEWQLNTATTYIVFLGDVVILSSNLEAIRELLARANSTAIDQLSENDDFRQAVTAGGDVIYFSDLQKVMAQVGDRINTESTKVKESGALRISSSTWENAHRFVFNESGWAKYLQTFHPKDLTAPRDLLPASTVGYYFMKPDLAGVWQSWLKELFGQRTPDSFTIWSMDFEKDVVAELGPECGVAMLDLPDFDDIEQLRWVGFCKLKTNKLAEALTKGNLFRGIAPTHDFAEVKLDRTSYFVAIRNGFLIISNHKEGLSALAQKSNLASTRDYAKALERVPDGIVAFGGYNLEAAVAAAGKPSADGLMAQVANVIFSLASAFHSQNLYATATAGTVEAKSSVAMDREGRYAVADFNYRPRGTNITFATLEPRGVPILAQKRISNLVIRIRSKAAGPIENIRDDITSADQIVEQTNATELVVKVAARHGGTEQKVQLPVTNTSLSQFLKSTNEFSANNKQVIEQAREIAGADRDAWSVARKLANWTYKNLTWKATAVANASQTLATREADCSEFSQLYVSMARSLGLPARIVSGLAYSGTSFGGHAWVEVWVGRWIELDPTWGTDFVDATHIRNSSSALVTSAALNLIDLEVLEANRGVADFQKSPGALAKELNNSFAAGDRTTFETALDLEMLTDQLMGAGEWDRMTKDERNQMSYGYTRALLQIYFDHKQIDDLDTFRFLHISEKQDQAEGLCLSPSGELLKLVMVNRQNSWHLIEIVNTDTGFHVIAESLNPVIKAIKEARAGRTPKIVAGSEFVRAQLLSTSNPKKAIAIIDGALRDNPSNQDLLFLKANALMNADERDAGLKVLTELSNSQPHYPPAIYKLAGWLRASDKEEEKKTLVDLYTRYTALEPNDPRGHEGLADAYAERKELEQAEMEFKKAVACDPANSARYLSLLLFLVENGRNDQIGTVLDGARQHPEVGDDLFGDMMEILYFDEEVELAEKFAASQPARMKSSLAANINLARVRIDDGRPLDALPLLNFAIQLDRKSIEPLLALAEAYRALSRWTAALKAANAAVRLDEKSGYAHYERACALARLGRSSEAMTALNKSIEIEPYRRMFLSEEKDFKSLSSLPAFKKLLAEAEKEKKDATEPKPANPTP
jgi:tetratricopeptide (TPR) repeat protein